VHRPHITKGSPKWSIRKDCLEALIAAADVPRILPGDYGEVAKALKKVILVGHNKA
jgi:hypothetical protein